MYSGDMPLIAGLAVLLLVVLAFVALVPVSIVLRYRAGTARRLARGWVAAINAVGFVSSGALFLAAAAVATLWVPKAFTSALLGLAVGGLLGALGLVVTRWEKAPQSLHYTPNRWLVLALVLVIVGRLVYGLWRGWHAWGSTSDASSWLVAAGAAGSLAAGGVLIGYYVSYWAGVWWQVRRHKGRSSVQNG
jgi:hypothetical protein